MISFYNTTLRNSKAFRSDAVCKDMAMLEPGTRAAVAALLAEAQEEGHDLRVLETYRSQTRQGALFVRKLTKLRAVGCHGYGVAADLGVFIDDKYQTEDGPYVFLRDLARKHGLISGEDWGHPKTGGFIDSGHVQRVPVWRQAMLFAGAWYPPAVYDPYADSVAGGHTDVVRELRPRKGPTLEEYRAAGYTGAYPPAGFAPVASPANPHAHAVEALPPPEPAAASVAELILEGRFIA